MVLLEERVTGNTANRITSCDSAVSRLFSSTVFRELAEKGQSATFARLVRESALLPHACNAVNVGDVFDVAFAYLLPQDRRDEYVYRSVLVRNIMLSKHSLRTASILNEFRVGRCRVDVAIFNGTATAYEIKSERDSLYRLVGQIETFMRFFARVVVVTGESHLESVLRLTPKEIGVMCLTKRHHISPIRAGETRPERVCPLTVFEALRINEAKQVLSLLGIDVPPVPNTALHSEMRVRFGRLNSSHVHAAMVRTLKRSRSATKLKGLIGCMPHSLRAAALSFPLRAADHGQLIAALNTRIDEAMSWA
jgi:hypothetical protein